MVDWSEARLSALVPRGEINCRRKIHHQSSIFAPRDRKAALRLLALALISPRWSLRDTAKAPAE